MFLALALKAGIAPYHFWIPLVIRRISWLSCLILISWQKLIPLIIITKLFSASPNLFSHPLILLVTVTILIGSLGGLNQTNLRPLIAFSSIQHIGWILLARMFSFTLSSAYLLLYILVTSFLVIKFIHSHLLNPLYHPTFTLSSLTNKKIIKPLVLILSGLPPLTFFFPKILTLYFLAQTNLWLFLFPLIITNRISLSFYTRLFIPISTPTPTIIFPFHPFTSLYPLTLLLSSILILSPLLLLYAMTILNKPQRHRYNILYPRRLIRPLGLNNKRPNPRWTRSTRGSSSRRPNL